MPRAWYLASVPRMLCTPSAFAPASKVSATTLAFVGIAVQFWPPRPGGTGWVAADAAGSGADKATAASTVAAAMRPILALYPPAAGYWPGTPPAAG